MIDTVVLNGIHLSDKTPSQLFSTILSSWLRAFDESCDLKHIAILDWQPFAYKSQRSDAFMQMRVFPDQRPIGGQRSIFFMPHIPSLSELYTALLKPFCTASAALLYYSALVWRRTHQFYIRTHKYFFVFRLNVSHDFVATLLPVMRTTSDTRVPLRRASLTEKASLVSARQCCANSVPECVSHGSRSWQCLLVVSAHGIT